jgi:hypothetical protein
LQWQEKLQLFRNSHHASQVHTVSSQYFCDKYTLELTSFSKGYFKKMNKNVYVGLSEIGFTEHIVWVIYLQLITVASVLKETETLRKTGRKLVWGSQSPVHGVAKVKSSVANDETGFKVFNFKEPIRK